MGALIRSCNIPFGRLNGSLPYMGKWSFRAGRNSRLCKAASRSLV